MMDWIRRATETLTLESDAIRDLIPKVGIEFKAVGQLLLEMKGRVVITGIGKSAIIAQKLVATFNSTGTPAIFMHAADAIHGDLGLVQRDDLVICISKSGNSPEIKALVPLLKSRDIQLIGMVGNDGSYLAQHSDFILDTTVSKEACPLDLAPTSSTAAQMAMGDALATCLMEARGFEAADFAQMHPGGALGKRLYTRLQDVMRSDQNPSVMHDASLKLVVLEMSSGRCGATAVKRNDKVVGIITDGDLRRAMENGLGTDAEAIQLMNDAPKTMPHDALAVQAFQLMEKHSISQIMVMDGEDYAGIVHLHDILREGIF
ncbi:MAG: KpsF/GutQ family sugar-phosphate isomerase [Crocinitomicaceae bacterium]|jgi:arabinose-5-phosphate isomerase|nr:KpsF/GutQ family sugar-phosphate isomerase [Crocinitomicaceae bacterium]